MNDWKYFICLIFFNESKKIFNVNIFYDTFYSKTSTVRFSLFNNKCLGLRSFNNKKLSDSEDDVDNDNSTIINGKNKIFSDLKESIETFKKYKFNIINNYNIFKIINNWYIYKWNY